MPKLKPFAKKNRIEIEALIALYEIREVLYLQTDMETNQGYLEPSKEWDIEMLERIAEIVTRVLPLPK